MVVNLTPNSWSRCRHYFLVKASAQRLIYWPAGVRPTVRAGRLSGGSQVWCPTWKPSGL